MVSQSKTQRQDSKPFIHFYIYLLHGKTHRVQKSDTVLSSSSDQSESCLHFGLPIRKQDLALSTLSDSCKLRNFTVCYEHTQSSDSLNPCNLLFLDDLQRNLLFKLQFLCRSLNSRYCRGGQGAISGKKRGQQARNKRSKAC